MNDQENYSDHINIWKTELREWVPDHIFDAHVHLGEKQSVVNDFTKERLKLALSTYSFMNYDSMTGWQEKLYSGKKVIGSFVFPFPLHEVDFDKANDYIIEIMKSSPEIKGFLWTNPRVIGRNKKIFDRGLKEGVRFTGVKPYFDILRKDNFKTEMAEILPQKLLDFINSEHLIIMLHTTGKGIGEESVRNYLDFITGKYKNIKIILAHMGRCLSPDDFEKFMKSDLVDHPAIFLDTSSATMKEVYSAVLSDQKLWGRILFGSDIPFGLITGTEFWSKTAGAIFRTRDKYSWSETGSFGHRNLTYNTYHVIKSLKDAIESLNLKKEEHKRLKNKIFSDNALKLLS